MKKSIIFLKEDNVGLIGISPDYLNNINEVIDISVPKDCVFNIIEGDPDIDLIFLGALKGFSSDNAKINFKYDIPKAKEIWLEHYRRARTPLLAALDVEFMREVESGNSDLQKEIAAKKQALRDVTKTELPNTLEEIKATWPEILGKKLF